MRDVRAHGRQFVGDCEDHLHRLSTALDDLRRAVGDVGEGPDAPFQPMLGWLAPQRQRVEAVLARLYFTDADLWDEAAERVDRELRWFGLILASTQAAVLVEQANDPELYREALLRQTSCWRSIVEHLVVEAHLQVADPGPHLVVMTDTIRKLRRCLRRPSRSYAQLRSNADRSRVIFEQNALELQRRLAAPRHAATSL